MLTPVQKPTFADRILTGRFSLIEVALIMILGIVVGSFVTRNTIHYYEQGTMYNSAVMLRANHHAGQLAKQEDPEISVILQRIYSEAAGIAKSEVPQVPRKSTAEIILTGPSADFLKEIEALILSRDDRS